MLGYVESQANSVSWAQVTDKPESFPPDTSDTTFQSHVSSQISSHSVSTQGVHGISDTSLLVRDSDARLTDSRQPLPHNHSLADISESGASVGDGISWDGTSWLAGPLPDVSAYLPLTGGTMSSSAEVSWTNTVSDGTAPGGLSRLQLYNDGVNVAGLGVSTSNFNVGTIGAINLSVYASGTLATRYSTALTRHYPSQFFNSPIYVSSGGSPTSPKYSFEGDSDTGIYSGSANSISLATSGVERLRVGYLGNVGVATSPSAAVAFGIDYSWSEIGSGSVIVHSSSGTPSTTCTSLQIYRAQPNIQSQGATTYGYNVAPATVTGGGTITTQIGFHCNDLTIGSTAHGFRGRINTSSGGSRYNLYMDGTAPNYLAGQVHLGSTTGQTLSWLPSLSFLYDTDTGIGRIASNTVSVFCGGDEVGRWRSDGGLSIGSASGVSSSSTNWAVGVVRDESVNNSVSVCVRSRLTASIANTYGFFDQTQVPDGVSVGQRTAFQAVGADMLGPGSALGTYRGFVCSNPDQSIANVEGFLSDVSVAAGSTRYAFNASGSAPSRFNGPVYIASGSSSLPQVSFEGDSDTGIFSEAANHFCVSAGGSEVLRITPDYVSTSGVGLALNVPSYPLPVNMANVGVYTNVNPALGGGSRHNFYAGGTSPNYFEGDIGIGTTTPSSPLDINGSSIRLRVSDPPVSSTASGNQGEIRWDANYLYICVATNTWRRAAITTW